MRHSKKIGDRRGGTGREAGGWEGSFILSTLNQGDLGHRCHPTVLPDKLQDADRGQGNQLPPLTAQNTHCIAHFALD